MKNFQILRVHMMMIFIIQQMKKAPNLWKNVFEYYKEAQKKIKNKIQRFLIHFIILSDWGFILEFSFIVVH
jgi:hypothetical protein